MSAVRKAMAVPQPLIGEGPLHQALIEAKEKAKVDAFTRSTGLDVADVSSDGGKSLDLARVFEALRSHGYQVSEPTCPQTQLSRGYTTWLVTVTIPTGEMCTLAFLKEAPK